LIRKVLERSGDDPDMDFDGRSLGEALLAPTRIYVRNVLKLIAVNAIDGVAHITGGGITENIVRVVPEGLGIEVDTSAWPRPAVFEWLQKAGNIEAREMLRTFNCGIGMVLVVPESSATAVSAAAQALGETCHDIGRVIEADGERVAYR
jgi:phosphoribosylformylglycinamidine cyclo-ligase